MRELRVVHKQDSSPKRGLLALYIVKKDYEEVPKEAYHAHWPSRFPSRHAPLQALGMLPTPHEQATHVMKQGTQARTV